MNDFMYLFLIWVLWVWNNMRVKKEWHNLLCNLFNLSYTIILDKNIFFIIHYMNNLHFFIKFNKILYKKKSVF